MQSFHALFVLAVGTLSLASAVHDASSHDLHERRETLHEFMSDVEANAEPEGHLLWDERHNTLESIDGSGKVVGSVKLDREEAVDMNDFWDSVEDRRDGAHSRPGVSQTVARSLLQPRSYCDSFSGQRCVDYQFCRQEVDKHCPYCVWNHAGDTVCWSSERY